MPRSSFADLVEVREKTTHNEPALDASPIMAFDGGNCPAEGDDTHAAAGLVELWRGANTFARSVFNPSGLTYDQVLHRMVDGVKEEGAVLDESAAGVAASMVH